MSHRTERDECIEDAISELTDEELEEFLLVTKHGESEYTTEHYTEETTRDPVDNPYALLLAAAVNHFCTLTGMSPEDALAATILADNEHFDGAVSAPYPGD